MALPQGWRRDFSTNDDVSGKRKQYETTFTYNRDVGGKSIGGTYTVVFNAKTGQRQIYVTSPPIAGVTLGRELLLTMNADGTKIPNQPTYDNIKNVTNGNTRIVDAINASQVNINRLINSSDTVNGLTAEEKAKLKKEKAFGGPGDTPAPGKPGGGDTGSDASGPNSGTASGIGTGTSFDVLGTLRNVSSFNDTNSGNYGIFWYPYDYNKKQDHLIISTYNYQVADVFANSKGGLSINTGRIFGGDSLSKRTLKKSLGSVTLPMPNSISESNQTGWGENSLNNLTAGLMGAALNVVSETASGNLLEAGTYTIDTAKNVIKSESAGTRIKQLLTLNAGAAAIKKLGVNIDAEAYRARVTGTAINPNLEMLFQGPKLRSFQFAYKLTPRSAIEAKHIRGIIKFFKKSMAPKRSGSASESFFLGAPNVFRIKFMNGTTGKESTTLPTLKTCALVNFDVNYTADGFYSAFMDGQPVSVEIRFAFAELTPIYNDNYGDNPEDGIVGFPGGSDGVDNLENPLFDVKDASEQAAAARKPGELTDAEIQRQSSRPENKGRSPEQIRNDPGAKALELQVQYDILRRSGSSKEQKEAALRRIQELSTR